MKTKRVITLILVLAAFLSLAGCGSQQNTPAQTATPATQQTEQSAAAEGQMEESGEMAWASSFKDVTLPAGSEYLTVSAFIKDGFYAVSNEKAAAETNGTEEAASEENYVSCILKADFEGNVTKLDKYRPLQHEADREGKFDYSASSSLMFVMPLSSGELATVEMFWENWVTEEGLDSSSDEYWEKTQYNQEFYYRLLDTDGSEKLSRRIPVEGDQYIYAAATDKAGNIVCTCGNKLLVISPEGEIEHVIESDNYWETVTTLADGTVFAAAWGDSSLEIYPVDTVKGEIGSGRRLPNGAYTLYSGGGDYPLYYSNGSNFYGFDIEAGEGIKLFSWLGTDIGTDIYGGIGIRDDGTVVGIINENDNAYSAGAADSTASYKLFEVQQVPASTVKEKKILTLATQWSSYDTNRAVLRFNRSNENYRIEILDYSEYNTEDDYNAGLTKLLTEIMAGNMPDMIDLQAMPVSRLAAKGLLEDLYPYLDADSELSRDRYFPNVLALCERDGKLVSTLSGFYLATLIGASSVVGDTPGWTYEEFDAALASMPDGCRPLSAYTTRDQILSTCVGLEFDKYVNWATGECNFNSEEFAALLKFASRFPVSFDWDNYDWQTDSDEVNLASGMQMLATAWISGIDNIAYNEYYFGGQPYTYIGYPTSDGTGNYISLNAGFGMCSSCSDKQAAWEFLRTFFTDEYQIGQYMLPASKSAFDTKLREAMTMEYRKNANGEFVLDENGEKIPEAKMTYGDSFGNTYDIYAITQDQADKLKELIETTTRTLTTDESILSIVEEQAEAFFSGQKTAEEVCRLIQSKANIYVNEQR